MSRGFSAASVLVAAAVLQAAGQAPARGVAPKKSVPTAKKTASKKTASKKTQPKKTGSASGVSPKKSATKKPAASKSRTPTRSWRTAQQTPTTERYREIQHALAGRGYFQGEPTGIWGPDSAEALKQFQQAQNLKPNGKVDSLSLLALGLGPKRNPAPRAPLPADPPPTPPISPPTASPPTARP